MSSLNSKEQKTLVAHFLEFFFVGLVMGITEDLLAIHFATEAKITPHVIKVAFLVALPFAVISELVVDLEIVRKIFSKKRWRAK